MIPIVFLQKYVELMLFETSGNQIALAINFHGQLFDLSI